MESDSIKSAILMSWVAISFGAFVLGKNRPDFRGPAPFVLFGLVLVSLHYFAVGYSISEPTTRSIIFAAMIWLASLLSISAFGAAAAINAVFRGLSLVIYPATAYLLYLQITGLGVGASGYFVGFVSNPNIMGGYIALIILPVALQNLLNRSRRDWRFFTDLLIVGCVLYLIYSTGSRGSALAAGISLVYLALISKSIKTWMKLVIVVLVFIAAFLLQGFFQKYADLGVTNTREYLVILRLEAISERPFFGWGLAANVNNSFNMTNIFPSQEKGNTALQFVEEFGLILGVPLFLSVVWICVRIASRLRDERHKVWLIVFLFGSLAHSMVETWMLNFGSLLAIAFWILLMFGGAYTADRRRLKGSRPLPSARLPV